MYEYDFEKPNLDLAEAVLEVADSCNSHDVFFTISKDDFIIDNSSFLRWAIKTRFPDIDEAALEEYILEAKREQAAKKAEEKAERERLKKEINKKINGQAQLGWSLAFKLCGDFTDEKAKAIRYRLFKKIPELSIQEKIDICMQYLLSIENINNCYMISDVYYDLAELSAQADCVKYSSNICDQTAFYLERCFSTLKDKRQVIEKIIKFCGQHNLTNEQGEVIKKYFGLYFDDTVPFFCFLRLLRNLLSSNHTILASSVILETNVKYYIPDLVHALLSHKEYDMVDYVLIQMSAKQKGCGKDSEPDIDKALWIESMKYTMKYYRLGYKIYKSSHNIFSYCHVDDPIGNRKIDSLKKKYFQIFSAHDRYLTEIAIYNQQPANTRDEFLLSYLNACEQEIQIIPQLLSFFKEYNRITSKSSACRTRSQSITTIEEEYQYKLANCEVFKKLSMFYEKTAKYDDAIRVCDAAISCGYLNDGTKMGMIGRKNRIIKKKETSLQTR